MKLRAMLRPVCWILGHRNLNTGFTEYLADGVFADHSVARCLRCGRTRTTSGLSGLGTERQFWDLLKGGK